MQLQYLKSSSVVVESDGVRVLCDPWLLDGAFYGSWTHYPPLEFTPEDFHDVDYIYVSHIHPDHFHRETMLRLDTSTPVLIHDYATNFLRQNIERLGFEVIELPHDERTHLEGDLHINILGADNCDPEVCGSYYGCGWWLESEATRGNDGSTQIDSMGVFDDGEHVVVNANDCRWPLSLGACQSVKSQYGDIDLLLMQYTAANFYPQCMMDYSHEQLIENRDRVIEEMYGDAAGFVNALEPRYYMPFAGGYTLGGSLSHLNQYVAGSTRDAARDYFETSGVIEPDHAECVVFNSGEWFDVATGTQSAPYTPQDPEHKQRYIDEVLSQYEFDFEADEMPTNEDLIPLVGTAYEHMEDKRQQVQFESETAVLLDLTDGTFAKLSMQGDGFEVIDGREMQEVDRYVRMSIDPRLLHRILRGPQYAHFNNAQIGSHIGFAKNPDVYERPLYYCMSFFHG